MKKNYSMTKKIKSLCLSGLLLVSACAAVHAQVTSTFEDLTLPDNSYWSGSDLSGGFSDGDAWFKNEYNKEGSYWSGGFVYSNKIDVTTAGYKNSASAYAGGGNNLSSNYAVANGTSQIKLTGKALGKPVQGVYITNNTYAVLSMEEGDQFAKKFGGVSGNDQDWFLLNITGYYDSLPIKDTVKFYLADFRFEDNTKDYIITSWELVDLTKLGKVDSLFFSLTSSDTGINGMNTPAYFALDDFNGNVITSLTASATALRLTAFPNPAVNDITINLPSIATGQALVKISDMNGREVLSLFTSAPSVQIPVSDLISGVYVISAETEGKKYYNRFIKQ